MTRGLDLVQYSKKDRRFFLKSASGLLIVLPFMESLLMPKTAYAATFAKRFIFLHSGHGMPLQYFPKPGDNFKKINGYKISDMTSIKVYSEDEKKGLVSPILADLSHLSTKFSVLEGIDYCPGADANHSPEACLMSSIADRQPGKVTIDHKIAEFLSKKSGRSISSTVINNGYDKWAASVGTAGKVVGQTDAKQFFKSLGFSVTAQQAMGASLVGDPVANQRMNSKKSVDVAKEEFQLLLKDSKISATDKLQLQEHINYLNELENNIFADLNPTPMENPNPNPSPGGGVVNPKPQPVVQGCVSPSLTNYSGTNFDNNLNLFIDGIVLAAKCNKAPVINLMMHKYDFSGSFNEIFADEGDMTIHEAVGHANSDKTTKLHRYFGSKVAKLIAALDSVPDPEGGGSLLDTSLIYWGNDMGVSNSDHHVKSQLPALIAGATGFLNSGNFIDYNGEGRTNDSDYSKGNIRPHNQLLITIMMAMGMTEADWGGTGYGHYGTDNQFFARVDSAGGDHKKNPLPGLAKV